MLLMNFVAVAIAVVGEYEYDVGDVGHLHFVAVAYQQQDPFPPPQLH